MLITDFALALRRVQRLGRKDMPDAEQTLIGHLVELQEYLKRNNEKSPKTTLNYARQNFKQIEEENNGILQKAKAAAARWDSITSEGKGNLSKTKLEEAIYWEEERAFYYSLVTKIEEAKELLKTFINTYSTPNQTQKQIDKSEEEFFITLTDKTIRELNIIDVIFQSQIKKKQRWLEWPDLINENGELTDGRFLLGYFNICSKYEFLNVQGFKSEITKRFESAKNLVLLQSQLIEIKKRAETVRDFYNDNLTDRNPLISQLREKYKSDFESGRFELTKLNRGVVELSHYYVSCIHFGVESIDKNKRYIRDADFNYLTDNHQLAEVCQALISFIDKFGFEQDNKTGKNNDETAKGFEVFLNNKGEKVLTYLTTKYKDAKPQTIFFMLCALKGLKLLVPSALSGNKTQLYNSLKATFGNIGTRQSLNANLVKVEALNEYEREQVAQHTSGIKRKILKK